MSAAALLARIEAARDHPYSGYVETRGTLQLPVADRFTDVGDLFGGHDPDAGVVAQPERLAGRQAAGHRRDGPGPRRREDHRVGLRARRGRPSAATPTSGCRATADLVPPALAAGCSTTSTATT